MRVIDKVEINYFRSVYSTSLSNLKDVNILLGTNDSGKSNVLKALHLFFNNDTELYEDFNFQRDFCRPREEEVRRTKGRGSIWIRVTFNNVFNWTSLPRKFWVKKAWNRYSDLPSTTYQRNIASTSIGKFLNKVVFYYIPAIREKWQFNHYLGRLRDTLIDDEISGFKKASSLMLKGIGKSTQELQERIKADLDLESSIQVPEDLEDLFSALEISTKIGNYKVPLSLRGDGIQSHHIPFILDFLAKHTTPTKVAVWGYEEPENSLEILRANKLAKQFGDSFSKDNQIFLSTHSPVFYDLGGDNVTKWRVFKEKVDDQDLHVTNVEPTSSSELIDKELGVTQLVAAKAKEIIEENQKLEKPNKALKEKIQNSNLPQIIVEGPSDELIFNAAIKKLGIENKFNIVAAEGAPNAASFIAVFSRLKLSEVRPLFGIVDNDSSGRREENKQFSSHKKFESTSFRIVNQQRKIYFSLLPIPQGLSEIQQIFSNQNSEEKGIPLFIEFYFPNTVIQEAIEGEILRLKERECKASDGELPLQINLTQNWKPKLPTGYEYFAYKVDDESKKDFANWLKDKPRESFVYFEEIFSNIQRILDSGTNE